MKQRASCQFQSLTWVERLSDTLYRTLRATQCQFQSLTWVERLSDPSDGEMLSELIESFNPSPGLNVFQTTLRSFRRVPDSGFNPSPGLNVFQTGRGHGVRG